MSELRVHPQPRPAAAPVVLDLTGSSQDELLARAETAERRLAFLSHVSSVLGSSLDYETTLSDLASLAVPFLADWCIVYLTEENDEVRRAAVTFADPADAGLADELKRYLVPDRSGQYRAVEAVRSGQPVTFPILSDAVLQAIARSEEHLDTLRRMALRSSICVPLIVQGQVHGALLFMTSRSARIYGPEDVRLAEDLAARAALAMENARLYSTAQEARRTVEELNERLQRSMVETHHRVKNNLQIIAAMIDGRLMDESDPVTRQDFVRLASNVRALSSVHDTLTHQVRDDEELDSISARQVLGRLLPLIQETAHTRQITIDVDDVLLSLRQGTSLALVVNELVSNAVKHGNRAVGVKMQTAGSICRLVVTDDGAGFPAGFDPRSAANTGLVLVDTLCRWDLAGDVEYSNSKEGGARVTVSFPLAVAPELRD